MKVLLNRFAILFIFAIICGVNNFAFAEWKNLQIVNYSGFNIYEFYMTHSGYGGWGKNLLKNTLYNGSGTTIRYDDQFTYFDIKLVFYDNVMRISNKKIDLSGAWKITIYYNGKDSKGADQFKFHKN